MKTYNIILKGIDQIEFPRIVNRAAQALIKRLCREVPAERLGYQRGGIDDIKKHRYHYSSPPPPSIVSVYLPISTVELNN
jgi:hypothetical protein